MPKLFEFLRASGISCAAFAPFIDENWKVPLSRVPELISLIEARELQFMEGVLRNHDEFEGGEISAYNLLPGSEVERDGFINDLRRSINRGST